MGNFDGDCAVNYIDRPGKFDAIRALRPNARFSLRNNEITIWETDDIPQPTKEEIQEKIKELELEEPMRLLREERNRRLAETDWWSIRQADGINMTNAQKRYRQTLRDLPDVAEPKIDENGNLINVFWPNKP